MVAVVASPGTNPVRLLRKQLHKTIEQAANEAGVHWQLWYLVECGCYEQLPGTIWHYFERRGLAVEGLRSEYRLFRQGQQREFGMEFFSAVYTLPEVDSSVSPVQSLRMQLGISRSALAKSLCIQPAHLYRLEKGAAKELPRSVAEALSTAGLSSELIDELNERQQDYYVRS